MSIFSRLKRSNPRQDAVSGSESSIHLDPAEYFRQLSPAQAQTKIQEVVAAYGATLQQAASTGALVHDESLLEHPKDLIQMSLLLALSGGINEPQQKERLLAALLETAAFQRDVAGEPGALRGILQASKQVDREDAEAVRKLAADFLACSPGEVAMEAVAEEQARLLQILKDAGVT